MPTGATRTGTPWWSSLQPLTVDLLAAAALVVVSVQGATGRAPLIAAPGWLTAGAAALVAAPVAVRRIWPLPAFLTSLAANTFLAVLHVGGNPALLVALTLYTVAVTSPPRQAVGWLVLALGVDTASEATALLPAQSPLLLRTNLTLIGANILVLAAAWALGSAAHTQRASAARAADERTQRAVADERIRIARELHDVITHSITLITVKAGVAHHLMDTRPEDARTALSLIEGTGRTTLTELRHLLGVLRVDTVPLTDEARRAERAPLPRLADLTALADRARDADVEATLTIRGATDLPEGITVTTYRIVQEALTNVVKHAAPAHCDIDIDISTTEVTITVTDDGPTPASATNRAGHGLLGMRERVALYAGQLSAGPLNRGYQVTARLPLTPTTTPQATPAA